MIKLYELNSLACTLVILCHKKLYNIKNNFAAVGLYKYTYNLWLFGSLSMVVSARSSCLSPPIFTFMFKIHIKLGLHKILHDSKNVHYSDVVYLFVLYNVYKCVFFYRYICIFFAFS